RAKPAMLSLPAALMPHLFSFVHPRDLAHVQQTCAKFSRARAAWSVLDNWDWMDTLTEMAVPLCVERVDATQVTPFAIRLLARTSKNLRQAKLSVYEAGSCLLEFLARDLALLHRLEHLTLDLAESSWHSAPVMLPNL